MTTFEITLVALSCALAGWIYILQNIILKCAKCIAQLQKFAIQQVDINSKTEEVQSILEDVNVSLQKIVESDK